MNPPREQRDLDLARNVERACDRFEAAWKAGRPRIEDHLDGWQEPQRSTLLLELILLDVEYRRRQGEACAPEDYRGRFADLDGGWLACALAGGDETVTPPGPPVQSRAPEVLSGGQRVGDYELIGEIGRGGMGVVFEARHVGLGRVVALKMILSGAVAGPAEMARFQTEAMALARLQHPGIVVIHEVGEHEGHPFFCLEYCRGGNLDKKLAGTPMQPGDAAVLVRKLAEAVQAAHEAKVVHRDLKPANVLLTEKGEPKITDFGLAKKLDEQGLTQTGVIMGTPSYVAPEQAQGKKEVGPLADVYALGAILYECLVGRPPFKAATPFDTLLQVVSEQPVPPRQLNAKVPRDLETVVQKCLAKEPARRYASAKELSEDLGRYLAGEPIKARPVGTMERAIKWVNRNRAVAALLALVFVALTAGTVVSTLFALHASRQAELAKEEKKKADENAKMAAQERDRAERTLARSLLRPLALESDKDIIRPEWEVLWELAENRHLRIGYLFVEEATQRPETSRQLRDRAAVALHAAVGLDVETRDKVEAVLLARMEDETLAQEHRANLARTAAAWDGVSDRGRRRTAHQLVKSMKDTKDRSLPAVVAELARRLEPKEGLAVLLQAIKDTKDSEALRALAEGVAAMAGRLEPNDAAQALDLLIQASKDSKDSKNPYDFHDLARTVAALAGRLAPKEAAQALAVLIEAIKDTENPYTLRNLEEAVAALAGRLEPKEAAQAAAQVLALLIQAIKEPNDGNPYRALAEGAAVLAHRLEPKEAAQALALLSQAIKDSKHDKADLGYLAAGVVALVGRLEPKVGLAVLIQAIKDTKESWALRDLAEGAAALACRLDSREATQAFLLQALGVLTQAIKNSKETGDADGLALGVEALAGRLEPKEAAQASALLIQAIKDSTDAVALRALKRGVSALASRLEPREGLALLIQAIKDTKEPYALSYLANRAAALAGHLEPREATQALLAQALAVLSQAIKDAKHGQALSHLAEGAAALAHRLEPEVAAQAAAHALAVLLQTIKDSKEPDASSYLAWKGVAALAGRLEPKKGFAVLTWAIQDTKEGAAALAGSGGGSWAMRDLAMGAAALAGRLEPKEAAQAAAQVLAVLSQAIKDSKDPDALLYLAGGKAALAGRLEPKEGLAVLLQAIKDTNDTRALYYLAGGVTAMAGRLESKEAAQALTVLSQAIKDTKDSDALRALVVGLAAVASRLDPKETSPLTMQASTLILAVMAHDRRLQETELLALADLLTYAPSPSPQQGAALAGALVGAAPLSRLTLSGVARPPGQCRLSTQQLVELLKMPTCVPEIRRVILDQLGNRYQRRFADHWEFVRFATERKLDLDFTSPPVRP